MADRILYRWQEEAVEIIREALISDSPDTTIAAVTGSGKTEVAIRIIAEWDGMVTVVVPRTALMTQWRDEFDGEVGRVGGGPIKGWPAKPNGRINIATINAMRDGKLTGLIEQSDYDRHLVVVDECHNLRGPKNRLALSPEITPRDAVLGLSATPHPTQEAKEVVEALCGPIRYSYRYGQGLADGVIPPFVLNAIQIPLTIEERRELIVLDEKIKSAMREANEDYSRQKELIQIAKNLGMKRKRHLNDATARYSMAVRLLNQNPDTPTMVFHDTIEGVERLAGYTRHLSPAIYHSKSKAGREEIKKFLVEETQHLYSCIALSEGFNAPRVQRAIMMSGPNAPLRRIQTLGRCLRGETDRPNEIYFFYVGDTKDATGLHNLLSEGDIPETIKVNGDTIEVVKHFKMEEEGLIPIEAPKRPKEFVARVRQKCAKCARTFKSEVGLNNHHCVPGHLRPPRGGSILDEKLGFVPKTWDEFMEGFKK